MTAFECVFDLVDEESHLHKCMFCGQKVTSLYSSRQIHAKCLLQEPKITLEQRIERKNICKECPKYAKLRCSLMDLGCRLVFLRYLQSSTRTCPLGKWPDCS